MSKAKEFWIFPEAQKIFASSIKDSIHVIEFKAYDTLLAKSLKLRADLDLAIEALEWYMENCEVCAYELMGGDGAPSGYLPYDEKWTKAKETLARLKND